MTRSKSKSALGSDANGHDGAAGGESLNSDSHCGTRLCAEHQPQHRKRSEWLIIVEGLRLVETTPPCSATE